MKLIEMFKSLTVYPLAFINLAVYALWIVPARDLLRSVLFTLLTDDNSGDRTFHIPYIVKSIDNIFWLVAAVGFLAMFVLAEYYFKRAKSWKDLLRRFVRVLSIQVITIGLCLMGLDVMISQMPSTLTWFALGSGIILWAVTLLKEEPQELEVAT